MPVIPQFREFGRPRASGTGPGPRTARPVARFCARRPDAPDGRPAATHDRPVHAGLVHWLRYQCVTRAPALYLYSRFTSYDDTIVVERRRSCSRMGVLPLGLARVGPAVRARCPARSLARAVPVALYGI